MAALWRDVLDSLEDRLDQELLPALYAAVSVPTDTIREELLRSGLSWSQPDAGRSPSLQELDDTADALVDSARTKAGTIGAAGALAGAAGVPPEALASLVATLRLAQRLAVVYGFDPERDRGQLMLWRAMGAAFDVALPEQGSLDLKVRDLPSAFGSQVPEARQAAAWMTRRVVRRALYSPLRRVIRWVPGLAVGASTLGARKRITGQGTRMKATFRRAWEGGPQEVLNISEAEELGG